MKIKSSIKLLLLDRVVEYLAQVRFSTLVSTTVRLSGVNLKHSKFIFYLRIFLICIVIQVRPFPCLLLSSSSYINILECSFKRHVSNRLSLVALTIWLIWPVFAKSIQVTGIVIRHYKEFISFLPRVLVLEFEPSILVWRGAFCCFNFSDLRWRRHLKHGRSKSKFFLLRNA